MTQAGLSAKEKAVKQVRSWGENEVMREGAIEVAKRP